MIVSGKNKTLLFFETYSSDLGQFIFMTCSVDFTWWTHLWPWWQLPCDLRTGPRPSSLSPAFKILKVLVIPACSSFFMWPLNLSVSHCPIPYAKKSRRGLQSSELGGQTWGAVWLKRFYNSQSMGLPAGDAGCKSLATTCTTYLQLPVSSQLLHLVQNTDTAIGVSAWGAQRKSEVAGRTSPCCWQSWRLYHWKFCQHDSDHILDSETTNHLLFWELIFWSWQKVSSVKEPQYI